MNYSLSSARKVDNYIQKIITSLPNGQSSSAGSILTKLKAWHEAFSSFNRSAKTVEDIVYNSLTASNSDDASNQGEQADILCTVLSTNADYPKLTTFKAENATLKDLDVLILSKYRDLTSNDITGEDTYLISAILELH